MNMKSQVNMSIDTKLIEALSSMNINVSGLVNDFLKSFLANKLTSSDLNELKPEDIILEITNLQTQLLIKKKELEELEEEEKQKREKELYSIPKKVNEIHEI